MSAFPPKLLDIATDVLAKARAKHWRIATAESCTGGLIAGCLTAIPGSSDVVVGGFVTYSNEAKSRLIGVPHAMIAKHGAVSEPVALAMAKRAQIASGADLVISCTGIAGPGGGTVEKPVGLVHMAVAIAGKPTVHEEHRFGDIGRDAVREKTVEAALALLSRQI